MLRLLGTMRKLVVQEHETVACHWKCSRNSAIRWPLQELRALAALQLIMGWCSLDFCHCKPETEIDMNEFEEFLTERIDVSRSIHKECESFLGSTTLSRIKNKPFDY